ncbi:TPA: helix-turn-helix transcriptional regulator [Pasteurella multocida]|nr:helix-turn-helix transcriptional regulator [Pasteurella multocida]
MLIKEIHNEISQQVMKIRREKGMTQEDLAHSMNCTQAFINQIENGTKECNIRHIYQIAAILNCSVYDLLPDETLDMENNNGN